MEISIYLYRPTSSSGKWVSNYISMVFFFVSCHDLFPTSEVVGCILNVLSTIINGNKLKQNGFNFRNDFSICMDAELHYFKTHVTLDHSGFMDPRSCGASSMLYRTTHITVVHLENQWSRFAEAFFLAGNKAL